MTSVRRALAISFAERYALIVLALAGSMLVARLLTPEEIGIYSVSLAVIGIAQVLRDFGIGSFLIQEKELTDDHVRTAFGFSLLIGSTLFIAAFFAAPFAARFYDEARMIDTLRISSLNFLVLPFCSISLSLLRRDMAFKHIAAVNLTAAVVGFVIIISTAYQGFGPNSMALGAVAGNVATGIGAWLARSDRKLLLPSFVYWRKLLGFGAQNSAASIVTTISMDINDLVLGKVLGFAPVAIISRAQGLMNLFHRDTMAAIRNVAFPAFAKAHREGEELDARHTASVTSVTAIAWPFYGFAALFSLEILRLMFGPQWDSAASLVPYFCLAGATAATSNLVLNAVMAVGRVDLVARAELIFQPIRAALIITAAIIFKSLLACAIAYLLAFALHPPFLYFIKQRCIPNHFPALMGGLWSSAKATLLCLSPAAAVATYASNTGAGAVTTPELLVAALLTAIAWPAAIAFTRHPLRDDPLFSRFTRHIPCLSRS